MKPLIGVSTFIGWEHNRIFVKLGQYYTLAVEAGGGMAVCVPSHVDTEQAADYVSRLDGIILSGGRADIQPHHYGELPTTGFSTVDPVRDAWEFALYKAALEQGKPVLGICRGAQVINVCRWRHPVPGFAVPVRRSRGAPAFSQRNASSVSSRFH